MRWINAVLDWVTDPNKITAIATAIIAVFTGTLFFATFGQLRHLKRSVDLARDEFNATHRPKIIVRNFQSGTHDLIDLPDGRPVQPVFIAQNIGYSTGKIIEVRSGTIVLEVHQKLPSDLSFPFKETFDTNLAGGERELFPANGGSVPTDEELFDIFAGEKVLFCLGTITYLDGGGIIRRETGFCRRYVHKEKRWEAVESEYEYAY